MTSTAECLYGLSETFEWHPGIAQPGARSTARQTHGSRVEHQSVLERIASTDTLEPK